MQPRRRHEKSCPHRSQTYRRCTCPIQVTGYVEGRRVRKSLDTRNWKHAEDLILGMLAKENPAEAAEPPILMKDACEAYLKDAKVRRLRAETLRKNTRCINRMAAAFGERTLRSITVADLRDLRAGWNFSPVTMRKNIEIMRAFFAFCVESGWVSSNPAKAVKPPIVPPNPTLPFTDEEFEKILWAVDLFRETHPKVTEEKQCKLKALVLVMRYSGIRISDAVGLKRDRIEKGKLFLYQAKTGTPVWIPLPKVTLDALKAADDGSAYYFWNGHAALKTAVTDWQAKLQDLFAIAGIAESHSHRFRDTFSCALLLKGVPIETVSMLLGHANISVTQRHYSPWIKSRQTRLEEAVRAAWG